MARVYDENGKIVGTTESQDIRLNQSNELYNSANLDEALKELAKVFTIEEQLKIMQMLLGYNEKKGEQETLDRTLLIGDLDILEQTLFALKNNDGTFNITMDDITVLGDATVTFDETAGTLKVVSTSTSGYQGIRINKSIPYNNEKEAFLCVVTLKNNLNNSVSVGAIYTNKDDFMDIDSNGFSRYEYAIRYSISQIPIYASYKAIDVEVENIKYIRIGRLADWYDIHNLDKKIANMNLDGLDGYAPLNSPDFTGDISLGRKSGSTVGANSVAMGNNVTASGKYSHAEGNLTTASGISSHAEGSATASGYTSHAEGSATASGSYSHAEGDYTTASGSDSHAEGYYTKASGQYQHVQGKYNIEDTAGTYAHIVGNGEDNTNRSNAHTLDWQGNAWYQGTVSCDGTPTNDNDLITKKYFEENKGTGEGGSVDLSGYAPLASPVFTGSISLGRDADITAGTNSFAVGTNLIASGANSHAEGYGSSAYGGSSHAEGVSNTALGYGSHAEGNYTTSSGSSSHSEGDNTKASGNYSHAEGRNTTALGDKSHAEGYSTNTAGSKVDNLSTSTSNDTIITAWNSNKFSLAKGESSHVEGKDNLALGKYSHAEGSRCIAYNEGHAEGCECIAGNENITSFGYGYHAEGYKCVASGTCSHAEGLRTIASGENQHVQGRLNIEDTENKYAHIVGNGHPASATRSNAHTLDWNGNAWYAGKVTAGKDPTEDNDLVTKRYVDGCKLNSTAVVGFNYSKNFGKCLYTYDTPTSDIILALLGEVEETEPTNKTELHFFINYTTAINITLPTNCKWQSQPTFEVGHVYELIFMYIPTIGWLGKYIDYQ